MSKKYLEDHLILKGIYKGKEIFLEQLMDKCIPYTKKIVCSIGGNFGMFVRSNWDVANANSYKIVDKVIQEFQKQYPGVEVKYTSGIRKTDYSEFIITDGRNLYILIVGNYLIKMVVKHT